MNGNGKLILINTSILAKENGDYKNKDGVLRVAFKDFFDQFI